MSDKKVLLTVKIQYYLPFRLVFTNIPVSLVCYRHGLINCRHQSKMSSSQKLTCKRILYVLNLFRYRVLNSCRIWSPTGLNTPTPSQPHTVCWVEPERRFEWQQFTKLSRKHQHDWLYLQSINSDKHLPQSPLQSNFFDDDILLWCLYSLLVHGYRVKGSWLKYCTWVVEEGLCACK